MWTAILLYSGVCTSCESTLFRRCVGNDWIQVDFLQPNRWLWTRESVEDTETAGATEKEKPDHCSCWGTSVDNLHYQLGLPAELEMLYVIAWHP